MSESDERLETVADTIDEAKRQASVLADEDLIDPDPVEGPADADSPTQG